MKEILLFNGHIYVGEDATADSLLVRGGKVAALDVAAPDSADRLKIDLNGASLVPGFLDIHTHGGGGIDVNAANADDFAGIGRFFASHGTTGWLCSILTDSEEHTLWSIGEAKKAMAAPVDGARLLGIHLEGPFLAPQYKGAMPEHLLQRGSAALFHRYQKAADGAIRYMTVAPEVDGVPEMIEELADEAVIAIGHSGASYEMAVRAIQAGAKASTHTFNAMGLFHQHRPAIMGAVLEYPVFCEAICDGRHLHPGSVRMLLACKGWDKVVAITDSIQAAGLPDGNYKLGVNDVVVKDGDAVLASSGVRAGSTLTTDQALRNLIQFTGRQLKDVLPLLTENPARLLGLKDKGRLEPGFAADFVILDDNLSVKQTWVAGQRVFAS